MKISNSKRNVSFHGNFKPWAWNWQVDSQTDSFVPTGQQDPYDKTGSNNNTVEVRFLLCLSPSGKSLALWAWFSCVCLSVWVCVCVHMIRQSWKQNILKRGFAFCLAFKELCLRHITTIQQGSKGRGENQPLWRFCASRVDQHPFFYLLLFASRGA